jgi:predicted nuclease of predicted toxin-antitoxin system
MNDYLIDENLPKDIWTGISAIHVTDLGDRKTDTEIWDHAKAQGFVIVTKDTDFYDRILLEGEPPKVVWIRIGNMRRKQFETFILNVWKDVEKHLDNHALIEVYEGYIEGIKKL